MTWSTTTDIDVFLAAAGDFLRTRPVDNTVLLTEAAYLSARPSSAPDQLYGWWTGGGAFVQAPAHPPVLSDLPAEALAALPVRPPFGVDGRLVDTVTAVWRRRGGTLRERSRVRLFRLGEFQRPPRVPGIARLATLADRPLLIKWYADLMAAFPGDPSEPAYVVDDPLSFGGMQLWEVDGVPVAMASRSRTVAGMTRLGAVYAPHDDRHGEAVFAAVCEAAREVAHDVLVFAAAGDEAAARRYRELGFVPVLDRVMLQS
ncbi:MAG: GNAT family N-acetyltransferase [Hamadaea sp.]|nr:GNAT family N-acetyltransferase [Hamadaea sp.]